MPLFGRKQPPAPAPAPGGAPRSFGFRSAWLAIGSVDPQDVARALGLQSVEPASWDDGLAAVGARAAATAATVAAAPVFVSPPVDGWVLCPFAVALAGLDQFDLAALSRRFGDAQRFLTDHVVEIHQWERWAGGALVRRYGYWRDRDEVLFDVGEPTEAETRAGLTTARELRREDDGLHPANEETTLAVAAAWSVSPMTLDDRTDVSGWGLLGTAEAIS
jgi:hypothetical protein